MVKILALFLATAAVAFGQAFTLSDQAFLGQFTLTAPTTPPLTNDFVDNFYPTNISGYPIAAWWVAENCKSATCTNAVGGITNWPDYSGNAYNLLKYLSLVPYISNNWLNTRSIARFSGGAGTYDSLKAATFTNSAALSNYEAVCVVAADWSIAGPSYLLCKGNDVLSVARNDTTFDFHVGSYNSGLAWPTNKWQVIGFSKNTSGRDFLYINAVEYGNSAGSPTAISGISMGGRYSDGHAEGPWLIAEVIIYNTNLTAEIRSNLFTYYTNKYFFTP